MIQSLIKAIMPHGLFLFFQLLYHRFLARCAALWYRNPSRHLTVIGVTGTNGKSTTVEMLAEIIEEAGYRVASVSSIRFRIADKEKPNDKKMTMPGRFFLQRFLRQAVRAGCVYAVLEVTSEGIKQFRHTHINFQIAVITNITPEHIDSHGSFKLYRDAKAKLFHNSPIHILNKDDTDTYTFLADLPAERRYWYSLAQYPNDLHLHLPGDFNRANALAAMTAAEALRIPYEVRKRALERLDYIPGRLEVLQTKPFGIVVDYAHTPDALQNVYAELSAPRLICVLGAAGGGRDVWKRPEMGAIASQYCSTVILTNEDPYDENPEDIIDEIYSGCSHTDHVKKVLDRREAIREALFLAKKGDVVVITGKGCESCIMGPRGSKIPWDDREVVREEIQNNKTTS